MSTVEAIIKFVGTYPAWAKVAMLAGLILIVGVALLSPRNPIDAQAEPTSNGTIPNKTVLKIHGVSDRGLPPDASVRVTAIVNGKTYVYPSLAGVDWLDVGATMSSQTFDLPIASRYEVRFEMDLKGSGASKRYVSQETIEVPAVPYTGEYRLYPTKADSAGVSRGLAPGASVRFSLE
jgi:hypothetical protein